jgi:hypothetical protein
MFPLLCRPENNTMRFTAVVLTLGFTVLPASAQAERL